MLVHTWHCHDAQHLRICMLTGDAVVAGLRRNVVLQPDEAKVSATRQNHCSGQSGSTGLSAQRYVQRAMLKLFPCESEATHTVPGVAKRRVWLPLGVTAPSCRWPAAGLLTKDAGQVRVASCQMPCTCCRCTSSGSSVASLFPDQYAAHHH